MCHLVSLGRLIQNERFCLLTKSLTFWAFGVLALFVAFATLYVEENIHNMLALILDPQFKELTCIIEFIGRDRAKILVHEYDR